MIRVELSPARRAELRADTRASGIAPSTDHRQEMVRLPDAS